MKHFIISINKASFIAILNQKIYLSPMISQLKLSISELAVKYAANLPILSTSQRDGIEHLSYYSNFQSTRQLLMLGQSVA